jgi:uncharacterized membrane protein
MSGTDELTARSWLAAGWRTFKQFPVKLILPGVLAYVCILVSVMLGSAIRTQEDYAVLILLWVPFVAFKFFIGGVVAGGWPFLCLRLSRGLDVPVWGIFDGFRRWGTVLLTLFLYTLIVCIGFLLLLAPGVIWSLKYGLSFFSIMDKGLGAVQSLGISGRITTGYKWQLFGIAAIGWGTLVLKNGVISLGTALESNLLIYLGFAAELVWWCVIMPWVTCAESVAYDRLLARQESFEGDPATRSNPTSKRDVVKIKDIPKSTLRLLTNPSGASVAVNGRLIGTTSEEGIDVPWDQGTIVVSKAGYRPQLLRFTSDPNVPHYLVELKPSSTSLADAKDDSVDMINSPKSIKSDPEVHVLRTPGSTNEVVTKKELYEAVLGIMNPFWVRPVRSIILRNSNNLTRKDWS